MLTIGKLGQQAGVKVPTIRYYEQIGILPEAERSAGNQRLYSRKALERLAFIRHARDLGFTLEAIRDLLSLSDKPDQSCAAADAIAKAQLREVESRILRLTALKAELEAYGADTVMAVGPAPMMKAVCEATRPFGVRTIVSLNAIMIDGTGMCGGCRVRVGDKTKFACIDGPDFDGHLVDWDCLINRQRMYKTEEKESFEDWKKRHNLP